MAEHMPWKLFLHSGAQVEILDAEGTRIASFDREEAARLAINAVNAHDDLVEALQALYDAATLDTESRAAFRLAVAALEKARGTES